MNYEIEMKARLRDPERVISVLDGFAEFLGAYDKDDSYYLLPGAEAGKGRNFRVRREGGKAVVTWKNRSFEGGMEVNLEREFAVGDPEAFTELCLSMGARPYIKKRKIGRAYRHEGFLIELSEVPPLGFFVEIEKTIELEGKPGGAQGRDGFLGPGQGLPHSPGQDLIEEIRERELAILGRLGLGMGDIEEKPYSLLLRERAGKAP